MSNAGGRLNTLDRIERRARAIIDPARSYESASECGKCARDVLALVNIARAAQTLREHLRPAPVHGDEYLGWHDRYRSKIDDLDAALSVVGDKERQT